MKKTSPFLFLALASICFGITYPAYFFIKRTSPTAPTDLAWSDTVVVHSVVDSTRAAHIADSCRHCPGGGSVSSVGLSLPSELSVSGSPVTGSGTLSATWANQLANRAFLSPNGSAGVPTFRAFLPGDISFLTDSITASRTYSLLHIHDSMVVERHFDTLAARAIAHDTADTLRKFTLDRLHDTSSALQSMMLGYYNNSTAYTLARIHDTSLTLRTLIAARMPGWSTANAIPKGDGSTGLTASSWTDSASVHRTTTTDTLVVQHAQIGDIQGAGGNLVAYGFKGLSSPGTAGFFAYSTGDVGVNASPGKAIALTVGAITAATVRETGIQTVGIKATADTITGLVSKTIIGTGSAGQVVDASSATLSNSTTGNAATATKWQTARNITVGSSTGPFDGTADINFTLTAIGAEPALGSSTGIQALFSNGSYRFWQAAPYLDAHTNDRLAKFGSSGAGSVENSSVRDAADANGVWTDENLGVQAAASNVLTDPGLYTGTGVPGSTNHYWKLKLNTSDGLDFWGTGNSVRARLSVSGDWSGNSFVKAGGTASQFLKADGSVDGTAYQAAGSYLPVNNPAFTGTLSGPLATIATGSDGLQIAKRNGSNAGWIGYPGYNTTTSGTRAGFWGWSDGAVGIDVASGTTFQLNIGTNQPLWADAGAIHAQVGVHAEGTGAAISAPNGDISTGKAEIVGTQVKTANYTILSTDPGTTIGNANGITITLPASDTEGKIRYIVAQVGALYIAASNTCQGYGMTLNTGTGTAWVYHSGAGWIRIGTP